MLATSLVILLACPPTAAADVAPEDRGGYSSLFWRATPYDHLADEYGPVDLTTLPVAPRGPPDPPTLPLWDLDATLAELEAIETPGLEWAPWVRWAIAKPQSRPATAHAALITALESAALDPARLAWWRALAPATIDDRDALLAALNGSVDPRAWIYLGASLALVQWELSCPVRQAADGACREQHTFPRRCWSGPTSSEVLRQQAQQSAQRCVEIGTTLAGDAQVVAACQAILDSAHVTEPVRELVPEPRSSTSMQTHGVVGPTASQ